MKLIYHIPGLIVNRLPSFQTPQPNYLERKTFTNQIATENAFKEFKNSRTPKFYANEIKIYFTLAKMYGIRWILF